MANVYHATGQVIDSETSQGIAELTIEAWDAASSIPRPLAITSTRDDGRFTLEFDFEQFGFKEIPDVFFKVLRDGVALETTESGVSWNANSEESVTLTLKSTSKDRSKAKDRVTAKQFLKTADFIQQSDFLGLFSNIKEKIGTRFGTIADAVSNSFLKTEFEPVKPGRNIEKEVLHTDVNVAKRNLEAEKMEVTIVKYNPRINKATFSDVVSLSDIKPGQKINLHEEDGIVQYVSVVKDRKIGQAGAGQDEIQKEDLKKLADELKATKEESLRKDRQIIELQQELLTIKQDHVEIKSLLKSKEFEVLMKSVNMKREGDNPK